MGDAGTGMYLQPSEIALLHMGQHDRKLNEDLN